MLTRRPQEEKAEAEAGRTVVDSVQLSVAAQVPPADPPEEAIARISEVAEALEAAEEPQFILSTISFRSV